jgi:hypothetical protein
VLDGWLTEDHLSKHYSITMDWRASQPKPLRSMKLKKRRANGHRPVAAASHGYLEIYPIF